MAATLYAAVTIDNSAATAPAGTAVTAVGAAAGRRREHAPTVAVIGPQALGQPVKACFGVADNIIPAAGRRHASRHVMAVAVQGIVIERPETTKQSIPTPLTAPQRFNGIAALTKLQAKDTFYFAHTRR